MTTGEILFYVWIAPFLIAMWCAAIAIAYETYQHIFCDEEDEDKE